MADEHQSGAMAPITAYHLTEAVRAGEQGASDALNNNPPAHAGQPSGTEMALLARVAELAGQIRQEAARTLNGLHGELMKAREALAGARYEGRVRGIEAGMRAMLSKAGGELEQRVFDALRAKREYEYFAYVHKRSSDPKPEKWQFILAFLMVPLAIESLLNGNFFADASDFGLVGGAATAVIISALNISLGFVMGLWPARYCGHVRGSHLFWALPVYAGMIVLIVLFNLAVGHYRELLIASPDAASQQVLPRLMANPLAIYELKSIALVLIGCLIAFLSAAKGYTAFGSYPGHGGAFRRWRQRSDAVETERRRLDAELLPELERVRAEIDGFRDDCWNEIAKLQSIRLRADQARDLHASRLAQLRAAKNAALMDYREANLRVRTDLPPAYFSRTLDLPEIDHPDELADHARLIATIEEAERELTHMPALIEAKLKDQLALVRGLDLAGEVERMRAGAVEAGRQAFERDEAARKQAHADFAAMPR